MGLRLIAAVLALIGVLSMSQAAAGLDARTIIGGPGPDVLRGTSQADDMRGLGGNDTLHGGAGADRLDGGLGQDALFGQEGNDSLVAGGAGYLDFMDGGPGDDVLTSNPGGTVRLVGGVGNDVLRGYSGIAAWSADTYSGGPGNDRLLAVDISNTTDAFLPNACGPGRDLVELLRVPIEARADVVRTLRRVHGCERIVFR